MTGSPKQRWADLSEDDEDVFTQAWRASQPFEDVLKEVAQEKSTECVDNASTPAIFNVNKVHSKRGGSSNGNTPKFSAKEQYDFAFAGKKEHVEFPQYHERDQFQPTGCHGRVESMFPMLPPSIDTNAVNTQALKRVPQSSQAVVPPTAAASDAFTVTLAGIPIKLCKDDCLEAIFWAAGVQQSALGYSATVNPIKKFGTASIKFASLDSANHCVNHFKSCSWASGKLQVDLVRPKAQQTAGGSKRGQQGSKKFNGGSYSAGRYAPRSFA